MNKIEKIIDSGFISDEFVTFNRDELQFRIKEYAEYYSNRYRQILINNCSNYDGVQMIEQKDIEELKLPEHE